MIPIALTELPYFVWANWEEKVPILDDGSGPMEPAGDFVEVWARNKREARVKALRRMRSEPPEYRWQTRWPQHAADYGLHPLSGLKVEVATCSHGTCLLPPPDMERKAWQYEWECGQCAAEIEADHRREMAA